MGVGTKFVGKRQFEIFSKNLQRKLRGTNVTFNTFSDDDIINLGPGMDGVLWEPLFTNGEDWIWGWSEYGSQNVFLGREAGENLDKSLCSDNVIIGFRAAFLDTGGGLLRNVVVGSEAGYNVQVYAEDNVILGYRAAYSLITSSRSVIIGSGAGDSLVSEDGDVVIGYGAGAGGDFGSSVLIGVGAGASLSEGFYNVFLGYLAGNLVASGIGRIAIGYGAQPDADYKCRIGGSGDYAVNIETAGKYISLLSDDSEEAPIEVASTVLCQNLNADRVDGHNIWVSDSEPASGDGADGDIWLEY